MFKATLIAFLLFLPVFSHAETEIYTTGQSYTDADMTIEADGYKFYANNAHTYTTFAFDNDITDGNGTYVATMSQVVQGTCFTPGYPAIQIRQPGVVNLTLTGFATGTVDEYEVEVEMTGLTGDMTEIRFYPFQCDADTHLTLHSLYVDGVMIFDFLATEEETATSTILLPPTIEVNLLATTTCLGSPTSSVCTYEYSTTSATSTEAQYMSYILQHLKTAFLYFVWLSSFLLILGVLLLFMRGRYGHY